MVPLPGEGLHGFTLRLSHRLDLTPIELLRLTGLVAPRGTSPPSRLMLMLDGDELSGFSSATGPSAKDADQLTFRPYVNSYPPITEALLGLRGLSARPRGVFPAWLLTTSTRYCPSCLAGNGSAIQQRHGGPWKTEWRMAANFACLQHRVFLLTTCPGCALPAQMIQGTTRRLIAAPGLGGLHPAQCRNLVGPDRVPCGTRLDSADLHDSSGPSPDLLDLQSRLPRAHLQGTSQALDPMAAHSRMTDLLILAAFIRVTWPLMAHQAPSESLAQSLDYDLKRPGPSPALRLSSTTEARWDGDPFSAHGTAALLGISARILNLPIADFRSELNHVIAQLPARDEPAWGRTWLMLKRDSSPLFKHEVVQALHKQFPRPLPTQAPSHEYSLHANAATHQRRYLNGSLMTG
ncbi:TniQ family protein [Streptomyces sp. C10]|uniref:TniQ family protein n=1 Tax=Streptomyces sp. C10 TaxID=531941 RepID=UPI0039811BFD